MHKVISFYKYIEIKNPEELMTYLRDKCNNLNILGRILIGKEGINGAVCGKVNNIEYFKNWISSDSLLNGLFSNLTFREQEEKSQVYHKLVTRIKDEIVALGVNVDLNKKGGHISPEKLKELLDNKEDIVLLDARNKYEAEVGKFKNAIILPIDNFRELPKAIEKNIELNKIKEERGKNNKKIVMYCTGGVRCEKSSALLKEKGFKEVYQLEGGIINYVNQFPNTHYEGSCYVFDDRKVSDVSSTIISKCNICDEKTSSYINCHNLDCDKLFICCMGCQKKLNKCCSEECKSSDRQRPNDKKIKDENKKYVGKEIGEVRNYFQKKGIAEVKFNRNLDQIKKIIIDGNKTDKLEVEIEKIIDHGEGVYTFPISKKVRRNDKVYV